MLRYRVAAPSIRFVPWAALASCWPLPQQLLPVSAAGGGRRRCTLRINSGKNVLNFAFGATAFAERSAAMKAPVGLLSGRAVCVSRWRGFAPTSSAERDKRIFTGGVVTEAAAAFSSYTVKRGCCAKCCATAPVVLCYIFSGTLILNMVSTLKMAFFTPMHRARRACCTAGSAP